MTSKIKVLSVLGTRPEAVKLALVIRALQACPEIENRICVTAQHREMLDQVLQAFDIHPDIDLNLMKPNQSLAGLTADIFTHLDPVLVRESPDWVFVQGDTTTVMAATLNAYYRKIKVGHVEAGLRTLDKWQPYPEEINRKVTGCVADLHFAPTPRSRENLIHEGVSEANIVVTGNPVIDAVRWISSQPIPEEITNLLDELGINQLRGNRLVLVTAHRRENFGEPLEQICTALDKLADEYDGKVRFVYPIHPNPHVKEPVQRMLRRNANIKLLPPLDYLPMVHLMRHAALVLTDSGGIQEEAPGFGIPTLVLREVTERPEGVEAGVLKLVGTRTESIIKATTSLLNDANEYQRMARSVSPFGDGKAADRILRALLDYENRS
ncbi:MAG: UDP-N-acetylglucosamine 2-epimerase (non-hydrolyzing) [Anaerolinea sp.]|nr:UDP-N-acetylglucosamine 2-epimerase (non-hydrolyzing) [Anaerolinea sp.]